MWWVWGCYVAVVLDVFVLRFTCFEFRWLGFGVGLGVGCGGSAFVF